MEDDTDNTCKLRQNWEEAMPKGQEMGSKETKVEQFFFLKGSWWGVGLGGEVWEPRKNIKQDQPEYEGKTIKVLNVNGWI